MKVTKKQKKYLVKILIIGLFLAIGLLAGVLGKEDIDELFGIPKSTQAYVNATEDLTQSYQVVKVVDGDTFVIEKEGREQKVRLIGVDTPESVHPNANKNIEQGKIASNYTKNLIEGKKVKIELDVETTDKYGRILAYVYLENGQMVNEILLQEGYAKLATYPPNVKYVEQFTQIQKQARQQQKGFWKEEIW